MKAAIFSRRSIAALLIASALALVFVIGAVNDYVLYPTSINSTSVVTDAANVLNCDGKLAHIYSITSTQPSMMLYWSTPISGDIHVSWDRLPDYCYYNGYKSGTAAPFFYQENCGDIPATKIGIGLNYMYLKGISLNSAVHNYYIDCIYSYGTNTVTPTGTSTATPTATSTPLYQDQLQLSSGNTALLERKFTYGELATVLAVCAAIALVVLIWFAKKTGQLRR